MIDLGRRVKLLRTKKGMTQATLAKAAGIKPPSLSQIETGRTKALKATTILRIAAALETNPAYLMTGTGAAEMSKAENPQDSEVLDVMHKLSPSKRATLLAVAQALAAETD